MNLKSIKIIILIVVMLFTGIAGYLFYEQRNFKETVVVSEGVTQVRKLSDYSDVVKGSVNDSNVYIFDSGKEGGTFLIFGGTHAEEPACNLSALVFAENLKVTQGKVLVINRVNVSGSLSTRLGEAYPRFSHIETPWGEQKFRFGDRCSSPLDSWPDPEVFIHYDSRQNLANVDIRNTNRTWPGRRNGLLAERTTYAIMELIRQENVDFVLDFHEAELEYPVENTIVTHERGNQVAAMTSMILSAQVFDVPIGMEFSPKALHGLSHREIGDASDAVSYLVEVAEPMLDRIRGITDEELLMSGKDRFVMEAGKAGLLYAPIDENGWPIDKRVARHVTTALRLIESNNAMNPDQMIQIEGMPGYEELLEKGVGHYLTDPQTVDAERVYYE